jgi:hypothetical protein
MSTAHPLRRLAQSPPGKPDGRTFAEIASSLAASMRSKVSGIDGDGHRHRGYLVSQSSIYRLLKANDLIASAAFTIIKAGGEFEVKTTALDQFWRVDFRYLKGLRAL